MDRDFKPDYPYSKFLVEAIHFAGPVADTHWVTDGDVMREEVTRNYSRSEAMDYVG